MKTRRILHVGKYFPPFAGGIENFMATLMLAQQRAGHQVAAIVHHHETFRAESHETWNDMPLVRVRTFGRFFYVPLAPEFPRALGRMIHEFKPDVLHLHVPNTSAFAAMITVACRRLPWILHWHSDVVASKLDQRLLLAYRFYRPFEQRLLAYADAVIVTSPPYLHASDALEKWKIKCHVAPLGIDLDRITKPDEKAIGEANAKWHAGKLRVLCVGRLTYYKGQRVLVRAVENEPNAHVLLVGRGDLTQSIKEEISLRKVSDRVTMLDHVSDAQLAALLETCDVLCLPSLERTEAFGLVLLEAMAHGKPVIASDIHGSGTGWIVNTTGGGLLVEPGNESALAQAISHLVTDRALLAKLAQQARKGISEFHINHASELIDAVYDTVS